MTPARKPSRPPRSARSRLYDGVIFDMDGTLVEPPLDFPTIRARLQIPAGAGILEAIQAMPPDARAEARQILLEHELAAAGKAQLMPGALQTLAAIRQAGLKTALLTRNAAAAMSIVIQRLGLKFDLAWSREQGPIKPEPDGVRRACQALGLAAARTLCVGDFEYDIVAANAAGAVSVLLSPSGQAAFSARPHHVISALPQLLDLLGLADSEGH